MRYRLYFPTADARGSTMLDYYVSETVAELAAGRTYESVYEGEAPTDDPEFLWRRHNVGDDEDGNRPRAREIRSMCVGDILVFENGPSWLCARAGFVPAPDFKVS